MSILDEIKNRKHELMPILARYGATNPRVFGSVARGQETSRSDIDLLVDLPGTVSLFDVAALQIELEELLRRKVDLVTESELHHRIKPQALREAVAL
jgi:hypothetical protein